MNKTSIRWETFPRDTLADVLFASPRGARSYRISADLFQAAWDTVQAGFEDVRLDTAYTPPRIFLLNDAGAAETFSWLKVYAPEVWPLSQFGRVVSTDDWDRRSRDNVRSSQESRLDRWASVIVGEALAQGEVDVQVASLPLARAFACYSTSIALSLAVHGTDDASRICADRLRQIESDRRFARRLVEVNDLVAIWGLLGMESDPFSPRDAVAVVLEAAQRFAEDKHSGGYVPEHRLVLQLAEFDSDSIEERVRAFHLMSNRLLAESERSNRNSMPPALLAAAAFLVGRGTSHEFLLHQVGKAFPAAPVWFGLIAALAGSALGMPTGLEQVRVLSGNYAEHLIGLMHPALIFAGLNSLGLSVLLRGKRSSRICLNWHSEQYPSNLFLAQRASSNLPQDPEQTRTCEISKS